jgi:hypothetical protein
LIVAIAKDFKIYLFFQKDCRIFCEGVKDRHNGLIRDGGVGYTGIDGSLIKPIVASVNDKLSKGSTKINKASSFRHMDSSTFQLVVASVDDKFSKGSTKSNNALPFVGKPNKSINSESASSTFQLVVALIPILNPEGVQAPSNIQVYCCVDFVASIIITNFEEAQAAPINSMLIAGYHYSKISLHFL